MRRAERGATLLELLVAVSLSSLLSLGVLYGMRVGIDAMEKTNDRFTRNRRVLGVEKALAAQLAGLMPVVGECVTPDGVPLGKSILFHGDPTAMRFVSTYSLQEGARGYPKLLEFGVIPGSDGAGVRLFVNELPYAGPASVRGVCVGAVANPETGQTGPAFPPVQPRQDAFVLADHLASLRFVYREIMPPPLLERWTQRWVANRFPSAIRIEITPLDANAAALQVMTTTIPIRLTVNPLALYAD